MQPDRGSTEDEGSTGPVRLGHNGGPTEARLKEEEDEPAGVYKGVH